MVFWVTLLGFFVDKIIPSAVEARLWLEVLIFCAGLGIATGSWLYLFQAPSPLGRRWYRAFRQRVTKPGQRKNRL
jgi:hypothetical protein